MNHSGATFDQNNVGHSNLFFHDPVILPYILNSIWWMNVILLEMGQYNTAFDLKINLGHSDLYFMVQWFVFYYFLLWKTFQFHWQSSIQASYAVLRQLLD